MHPNALIDTCARLLAQVLTFQHAADQAVATFFREHRQCGPRERQQLSDMVYAVLRDKPRLQWLAGQGALGERLPKDGLHRRLALLAFRGDPSQLVLAATPDEQAWLAVSATRSLAAAPAEARHTLPLWLADALRAETGEGFDALAAALNQPAPLDLRLNPLKAKRPQVLAALAAAGLDAAPTPHAPGGLRLVGKPSLHKLQAYADGWVEVQDEGSQLLALLPEVRRNEVVVDFCAGAGGKTLAMGAAMRNTGRLYAFDTSGHRLEALKPRLARSGLTNVHTMALDSELDPRLARLAGKADRVLVDAPCSGLGTLRRSPDLKWRTKPADIQALADLQGRILASAARLVKPGGRLVYATCSLLAAENEAVVQAFAASHPGFRPVPVGPVLAAAGVAGAAQLVEGEHLRLWPHLHGTDGFFAAVWQQKP